MTTPSLKKVQENMLNLLTRSGLASKLYPKLELGWTLKFDSDISLRARLIFTRGEKLRNLVSIFYHPVALRRCGFEIEPWKTEHRKTKTYFGKL